MATSMGVDVIKLYPEQVRALDYLRRRGTEASADKLREQLAAAFTTLEEALDAVPEKLRPLRPREGAWSAHEVLDHLVETNEPGAEELRGLINGRRPEGEPIPANLLSEDPLAMSWDELMDKLRAVHREILAIANEADDSTALDVRAPLMMVVKVPCEDGSMKPMEWIHDLDWKAYAQAYRVHTLQHVEQIKRNVAELDTRENAAG